MAVKVTTIKANTLEEGLKAVVEEIEKEISDKEEDKDCKECEHKEECSLENVKKEALEFLDAVFNLTLIQLKKEYQEEFKKKYEEFRKKEWAYLVAIPMQKYSATLCKGFETMMNDEKGMQTLEILGSALDKMNVLNK